MKGDVVGSLEWENSVVGDVAGNLEEGDVGMMHGVVGNFGGWMVWWEIWWGWIVWC